VANVRRNRSPPRSRQMLVVEDSPDSRVVIKYFLEPQGFECFFVAWRPASDWIWPSEKCRTSSSGDRQHGRAWARGDGESASVETTPQFHLSASSCSPVRVERCVKRNRGLAGLAPTTTVLKPWNRCRLAARVKRCAPLRPRRLTPRQKNVKRCRHASDRGPKGTIHHFSTRCAHPENVTAALIDAGRLRMRRPHSSHSSCASVGPRSRSAYQASAPLVRPIAVSSTAA